MPKCIKINPHSSQDFCYRQIINTLWSIRMPWDKQDSLIKCAMTAPGLQTWVFCCELSQQCVAKLLAVSSPLLLMALLALQHKHYVIRCQGRQGPKPIGEEELIPNERVRCFRALECHRERRLQFLEQAASSRGWLSHRLLRFSLRALRLVCLYSADLKPYKRRRRCQVCETYRVADFLLTKRWFRRMQRSSWRHDAETPLAFGALQCWHACA